jgi:hypothetical protein
MKVNKKKMLNFTSHSYDDRNFSLSQARCQSLCISGHKAKMILRSLTEIKEKQIFTNLASLGVCANKMNEWYNYNRISFEMGWPQALRDFNFWGRKREEKYLETATEKKSVSTYETDNTEIFLREKQTKELAKENS